MLSLSEILNRFLAGQTPTSAELEYLASVILSDRRRSLAFGITSANVEEVIQARSHLLLSVYPNLHPVPIETLWNLWLPLAMQLAQSQQQLGHPLIQGILGGQGTGKTTLATVLTLILKHLGKSTLSLSLDDLYKTYSDRLALRKQERRLIWRGPPGTHDIDLGLAVLDRLRHPDGQPIPIPRFDKSAWNGAGDRTQAEIVQGADIVLFEGWFVGVRPIDPVAFENPPLPILTADDKTFARDMNARLEDYLPLWARLDRLMVLYPVDYRLSLAWRQQAEREMIAAGKSGMSDSEINEFVKYFWKSLHPELFIKPLTTNPNWVDLVIEINADHSPGDVYRPSDR
ncbi:glycerate kinase [Funiculus sociatus GB2-A5]|uniref:Glycerate kinase n=1 Tax=Funiculus sociatus GB2-A5 TaxID=2933946 RepID=A0ABV0JJ05_9CYAN|nr:MULTISPECIES: glycerate kinase [unclassified Trichocoleus]MBD1907337.1 glycerate kinase [Trichocoleus sp. FACHB-832]MBD2062545.1 glycerate kinase [Trichocoleus sp. FACHB-6]